MVVVGGGIGERELPLAVASTLESLEGLSGSGGVGSLLATEDTNDRGWVSWQLSSVLCDACHPENFVSQHYPDSC